MEYFICNGVHSYNDLEIIVQDMPIVSPKKDVETIKVNGRSNDFHIDNGTYSSYSKTIKCVVKNKDKINLIKSTLQGICIFEFSNIPNVEFTCVVKNQIPFDKYLSVVKTFPLQLDVNPIGKSKTETVVAKTANSTFTVGGNVGVKPILEIKGSGTATITINNASFTLTDLTSTATMVDCDLQNVTKDSLQANDIFSGVFPSLKVGINNLTIVGTITEIKIRYREGWI